MSPKTLRFFKEQGIKASVSLVGADPEDCLQISEQGLLAVPQGTKPTGFQLAVMLPSRRRVFVVQKSVGQELGGYHKSFVTRLSGLVDGFDVHMMNEPIEVARAGQNVWTSWHQDKTNRMDCWWLGNDGRFADYQVGVLTHDNGRIWRLHGEYRWKGQLFQGPGGIVAKPESPVWGVFANTWKPVFQVSEFQSLLETTRLQPWSGSPEDLDPPLPAVPGPNSGVVQWYVPFAGQTGQGIVGLHESLRWKPKPTDPSQEDKGLNAWVHGIDIHCDADPDGVKRLRRGDVVSFVGNPQRWGHKEGAPPKLLGVKKFS